MKRAVKTTLATLPKSYTIRIKMSDYFALELGVFDGWYEGCPVEIDNSVKTWEIRTLKRVKRIRKPKVVSNR